MASTTKFPEIFASLAAAFPNDVVKSRAGGGGKELFYITARHAMIRLDEVLGPENWSDRYYSVCDVLFCEITITLPDGTKVAKADAGGFKQMMEKGKVDEENTDKTGPSDAFKRAAARFGVGRYLYNDGYADYNEPPPPPVADNKSGHGRGSYASPEQTRIFTDKMTGFIEEFNRRFLDSWTGPEGLVDGIREPMSTWAGSGHLVKWAVETGRLDGVIIPENCKASQRDKYVAIVYHRSKQDQAALAQELRRYGEEKAARESERWIKANPGVKPECPAYRSFIDDAEPIETDDDGLPDDISEFAHAGREPGAEG